MSVKVNDKHYKGEECSKCGNFIRYKKSKRCVGCCKRQYRDWSSRNKERIRLKDARWYSNNKDKARAANRQWQKDNATKLRDKARQRYEKDPEHVLAVNKKWRDNNPEKARKGQKLRSRKAQLAKYDLSLSDYDLLLEKQSGRCAICYMPPKRRHLHVDHCHKTGEVRGLLCGTCNRGLGHFKDDPNKLSSAIRYLNKFLDKKE